MWEGGIIKVYNSLNLGQTVQIMGLVKNIVYQYPYDLLSDEIEIDLTGELHFTKGDIIVRRGKNWKINSVTIQKPIEKLERPTLGRFD